MDESSYWVGILLIVAAVNGAAIGGLIGAGIIFVAALAAAHCYFRAVKRKENRAAMPKQ